MPEIIVEIDLPPDEFLKFYQGVAGNVETHSLDGRTVILPANRLRPFVKPKEGIRGRFLIQFNEQGKFQSIKKLS